MISLLSAIIINSIKSFVSSSFMQTRSASEVVSNISKVIVLLITLSIVISSIFLLCCYSLNLYLLNLGFSYIEALSLILGIKSLTAYYCICKIKYNIAQIKEDSYESESKNASKKGLIQRTFSSFVDGFNSK